jgi:hypothetical protein
MKSERKFKVGDAILEKGYREPIYVTQVNEVGYYTTWCSDFGEIEHYTVPFELEDNYELLNEKK